MSSYLRMTLALARSGHVAELCLRDGYGPAGAIAAAMQKGNAAIQASRWHLLWGSSPQSGASVAKGLMPREAR